MREGGGGGECQLERVLQQEAAEDHEVVAVAVLRLHDGGRLQARRVHEVRVVGLAQGIPRVVVLQLLLPEGVDEVGFQVVGRVLDEGGFLALLADVRVALAEGVEPLLLGCFDNEWVDVYGSARVSGGDGEGSEAAYFLVAGSRDTIVKVHFTSTSSFLMGCPSSGTLATCMEISRLLLPVA